MSDPLPEPLDLRDHQRPDLLAAFTRLYDTTFTDPSEREDPAEWPDRLWGNDSSTTMHLLIVPTTSGIDAAAGLAFEYFPRSSCGLLTYLVVEREWRRTGLARELVTRAATILKKDALDSGRTLEALFAETENPALVSPDQSAIPPSERLRAFDRLGARWVDIPYVQPALTSGGTPCRHLLLVAFPLPGSLVGPNPTAATILAFVEELYRALEVEDPLNDTDFQAIKCAFTKGPKVRPILEALE